MNQSTNSNLNNQSAAASKRVIKLNLTRNNENGESLLGVGLNYNSVQLSL